MSQVTQYPIAAPIANRYICTSSTRPASPLAGWEIYETDTKKTLVYDTTLGWIPPWNLPWGKVASDTDTATTTFTPSGTVAGLSISFTSIAGRTYRLYVSVHVRAVTNVGSVYVMLSGAGLTSERVAGFRADGSSTNADRTQLTGSVEVTPSAGSQTITVSLETSGTSCQIIGGNVTSRLWAEDIGPA